MHLRHINNLSLHVYVCVSVVQHCGQLNRSGWKPSPLYAAMRERENARAEMMGGVM